MRNLILLITLILTIGVVNASQIILNPLSTQSYFVWKINYSDASNLTVGNDYIKHGGITIHVTSDKMIEFDILGWNPLAKTVDGETVIKFQTVSDQPASFSAIIEGLIADKYYTVLRNKTTFTIVTADNQGKIQFNGTSSSHVYEIVTGYQPAVAVTATPVGVAAIEEKPIIEKVINFITCFWWLLLIILLLIAIYFRLRSY